MDFFPLPILYPELKIARLGGNDKLTQAKNKWKDVENLLYLKGNNKLNIHLHNHR